jgi:hypothetical protein
VVQQEDSPERYNFGIPGDARDSYALVLTGGTEEQLRQLGDGFTTLGLGARVVELSEVYLPARTEICDQVQIANAEVRRERASKIISVAQEFFLEDTQEQLPFYSYFERLCRRDALLGVEIVRQCAASGDVRLEWEAANCPASILAADRQLGLEIWAEVIDNERTHDEAVSALLQRVEDKDRPIPLEDVLPLFEHIQAYNQLRSRSHEQ